MDTMRGNFGSLAETEGYDPAEDEPVRDTPPPGIGQDERRMQVRAYNHWAGLLDGRNLPAIEDLEPDSLPDFGPYSVLLDFTAGIENPGISYLGDKLAEECGIADDELRTLADVPSRSLLTRITDHYMQILANQAPIGFEAEFVNQRGATILYRGILLPYSSDDDTIDFIYGVINWKELADPQSSDELLLEVDQALEPKPASAPAIEADAPLTDWADGPGAEPADRFGNDDDAAEEGFGAGFAGGEAADDDLPMPSFGLRDEADEDVGPAFGSLLGMASPVSNAPLKTPLELPEEIVEEPFGDAMGENAFDALAHDEPSFAIGDSSPGAPATIADDLSFGAFGAQSSAEIDLPELHPSDMELGDWLAAAREMAAAAHTSEDRTRTALYEAIGRAYDFSLAAAEAPHEFDELLTDAGLTMQDRAPMTPVVKLVFGADYDKTRLTEYAAALGHAHRLGLARGGLGEFLASAEGGLKGVVRAERRLRKEEAGKDVEPLDAPRQALAKKLRAMPERDFSTIPTEGSEFALVMIRRTDAGDVVMLGEVPDDVALVERAARKLIG